MFQAIKWSIKIPFMIMWVPVMTVVTLPISVIGIAFADSWGDWIDGVTEFYKESVLFIYE